MSLLPLLLSLQMDDDELQQQLNQQYGSNPWLRRVSRDNHFGLGIHPEQLRSILLHPEILRQASTGNQQQQATGRSGVGKDGFQVCLDVQQFQPNEITVKTIDDNMVMIEGQHEEREDAHGLISRHFVRKYRLPKEVNAEQLVSTLSSDGILTIKAPLKQIESAKNERVIQIQQTGPAKNTIKENPKEEKNGDA